MSFTIINKIDLQSTPVLLNLFSDFNDIVTEIKPVQHGNDGLDGKIEVGQIIKGPDGEPSLNAPKVEFIPMINGHGKNGENGPNGDDGMSAECWDPSPVLFSLSSTKGSTGAINLLIDGHKRSFFLDDHSDLIIDGSGKKGGDGLIGGDGGNGGHGIKGLNGGKGGNGKLKQDTYQDAYAGDGADGTPGCNGGNAGNGGNGGKGGDGSNGSNFIIELDQKDTAILSLIEVRCDGGKGGKGSKAGEPGAIGKAGKGGSPGEPGNPGTFIDDADLSERTVSYKANPGKPGIDGKPGKQGVRGVDGIDGKNGQCGSYKVKIGNKIINMLNENGQNIGLYNITIVRARITSADGSDTIVPGQPFIVDQIEITNSGGMPLPSGLSLQLTNLSNCSIAKNFLNEVEVTACEPTKSVILSGAFHCVANSVVVPLPNPVSMLCSFVIEGRLLNRKFGKNTYSLNKVAMYPISLSHLKGPFVHGQTFTLQLDEAGIVQDSFKMCVNNSTTTTTFNNVEISFELIDEGHPTVNIEPLGRNYVREKKLLPNITQELPLSITVLKTAVFRDTVEIVVTLFHEGVPIQKKSYYGCVVQKFNIPEAGADILLFVPPSFNKFEVNIYRTLINGLGLTFDLWDTMSNGGISKVTAKGNESNKGILQNAAWIGHYDHKLLLLPCESNALTSCLSMKDIANHLTKKYPDPEVDQCQGSVLFLGANPARLTQRVFLIEKDESDLVETAHKVPYDFTGQQLESTLKENKLEKLDGFEGERYIDIGPERWCDNITSNNLITTVKTLVSNIDKSTRLGAGVISERNIMDKAYLLLGEVDKKQPECRHKIATIEPDLKVETGITISYGNLSINKAPFPRTAKILNLPQLPRYRPKSSRQILNSFSSKAIAKILGNHEAAPSSYASYLNQLDKATIWLNDNEYSALASNWPVKPTALEQTKNDNDRSKQIIETAPKTGWESSPSTPAAISGEFYYEGMEAFKPNFYKDCTYWDAVDKKWITQDQKPLIADFHLSTEPDFIFNAVKEDDIDIPIKSRFAQTTIAILMSIPDHKLLDLLKKCLEAKIALKNFKKENEGDANEDGEYNLKATFPKCVFWTYKCDIAYNKTTRTRIPFTEIIETVLYFSIKREFYEFKADNHYDPNVFPRQKAIVNHIKNLKETYQTPGNKFKTEFGTELAASCLGLLERLMLTHRGSGERMNEFLSNLSINNSSHENLRVNMRILKNHIWEGDHKSAKVRHNAEYLAFQKLAKEKANDSKKLRSGDFLIDFQFVAHKNCAIEDQIEERNSHILYWKQQQGSGISQSLEATQKEKCIIS